MKLTEVKELLGARVLTHEDLLDNEVFSACGSDLMSDVLAYVKNQGLLLTGLTNLQVVRTAEMMDIHAIVFVRGKEPPAETIKLATERDLVIMSTSLRLYEACGILYSGGLRG